VPTDNPNDLYIQQMYAMIGMTNYKTMKCYYFQKDNYCKNGNACQFAHADSELRTPVEMEYLTSIANSINYQVSGEGMSYPQNYAYLENQNVITSQYQTYDPYAGYDYSYTPDTNYGDQTESSNTNNNYNNYYNAGTQSNYYDYSYNQSQNYPYNMNSIEINQNVGVSEIKEINEVDANARSVNSSSNIIKETPEIGKVKSEVVEERKKKMKINK
jgi:hypothetical protein